jgi:hypothetical protein
VLFKTNADTSKQKLAWKWLKGAPKLTQTDFGDPVNAAPTYKVADSERSRTGVPIGAEH